MITECGLAIAWPSKIAAVAFDMDGLLLNTEELYFEVFDALMQRRGQRYTAELRRSMMGLPGPQAFELLIGTAGLTETAMALESECDELFEALLATRLTLLPGVIELLDLLDTRHLPRCVATSSRRSCALQWLSTMQVLERFDLIITAEEVQRGKPHPDIYLEAARRMQVSASDMLVLEDSQNGVRAAVAAGACTVAVPGDHSREHDFSGACGIAQSLADSAIVQLIQPSNRASH